MLRRGGPGLTWGFWHELRIQTFDQLFPRAAMLAITQDDVFFCLASGEQLWNVSPWNEEQHEHESVQKSIVFFPGRQRPDYFRNDPWNVCPHGNVMGLCLWLLWKEFVVVRHAALGLLMDNDVSLSLSSSLTLTSSKLSTGASTTSSPSLP